ncbi:hypothetical protein L1049_015910 [Liquidambar formosana]|uniref:Uncharacterized protein n=1 Tax=Liquidambar formosana TaxID=63359 RepID=A0AAP0RZR9_LIQFO
MVQQMVDSKSSDYGLGNTETGLPTRDKQLPVALKKTALRDVQNENRIMAPTSMGNSLFSKERGPIIDAIKISGTKRPPPECPVSPTRTQSPSSNAANGHLVYVRRKSEAELGKSSTCGNTSNNADYPNSRQVDLVEEEMQLKPQMKEPKISCFPAFAPNPVAPLMNLSGKSPGTLSLGKSGNMLPPAEPNYLPLTSAFPSFDNSKGTRKKHWEERSIRLRLLLRNLDQSEQVDYLLMLRSLSSVELSRHAVELEKRSIQLSLEEAKELQRVGALNVLGKSMKNFRAPSTQQDQSEK